MKYYIEYPIPIICGLKCPYCFHQQLWQHNERYPNNQYGYKCAFTFPQYRAWRDKHLSDADEILMELHGGEMSYMDNQDIALDIIDSADKERFQLQTNGLGDERFYLELAKRKDKIDRIGFTYHRTQIAKSRELKDRFGRNVLRLQRCGVKVYVKELLILEHKTAILRHKGYCEDRGVEFRIQDFKGNGLIADEVSKYTPEDWALIHPEYCHYGKDCHCREGYRQILIRGYDDHGGDVLGCWQDHKRIGSIPDDWYEPYENVSLDDMAPRGRTVNGGLDYRSDYMRDIYISEREQYYYNTNQRRYWMLARLEAEKLRLQGMIAANEVENARDQVHIIETQRKAAAEVEEAQKRIAQRDDIIKAARGGIQMTDVYIAMAKEPEAKAAEPAAAPAAEGVKADAAADPAGDAG